MSTWRPLLITLAIVAALVGVVTLTRLLKAPGGRQVAAPPPGPTPVSVRVYLFFPGDDGMLHRETREVPELPASTPSRIRAVVAELLAGSREGLAPVFPWPATVDEAFVDGEGRAYVDLSPPPADLGTGSSSEVALAYGVAATVVANCPGVTRVQLLFGGREVETLGHLDLSQPLLPRPELIAR